MKDIKVGDMVKIVRRPLESESKSFGWFDVMDSMVGNIYKAIMIYEDNYVALNGGYIFPMCCCEKANSNEVIISKYSYKGVTDFNRIIEDNKDELAFIIKGKNNCVIGLDKRIKYDVTDFFNFHKTIIETNKFIYSDIKNITKFNFFIVSLEDFSNSKKIIEKYIQDFKSATVKKVYTFK